MFFATSYCGVVFITEQPYKTKSIIFWDVTPCAYLLVLAENLLRPRRWKRYVPPKRRLHLNRLHGATSQKNTYLKIFPSHESLVKDTSKGWLAKGILISCRHKKDLYLLSKMSNNIFLKDYYKKYCKILISTAQLAKKLYYNKLISQSSNKTKTACNVIKSLTNKRPNSKEELMLNIEGKQIQNPQILADNFNNYFSKVVDESVINIIKQNCNQINQHSHMESLVHAFQQPFLPISFKSVTEK
jgi:hypothetical protein